MPEPEPSSSAVPPAASARPFYAAGGLNAETYDARTGGFPGEIDWWVRHAVASGGPVLELACGTGRVTWPIARSGVPAVGLDRSPAMLRAAEAKRAAEPRETSKQVRFVAGDMASFSLGETFALVIIPARAFQALLTVEQQRGALDCIHAHLRPGGRLQIDLFDPRLELLLPELPTPPSPHRGSVRHPVSGNVVSIDVLMRRNDPLTQVLRERWRFTETGSSGDVLRQEDEILELRWTYRQEMRHLLELCAFEVEGEFSDFQGGPPAYGREQIWVARRG